jgi:uncharacterized protein (TIGR02302 family)
MNLNEKINNSLPLILKLKIAIARFAIIWENLASHLFKVLILSLFFIILILIECFPFLPYWLHIILLAVFLLSYITIIINFIFIFKWPTKIICAKRVEEDNNIKHMPFSSLFDKPALNQDSVIWKAHYKNILKISMSLKNIRLKSAYSKIDPLFIRLPVITLFLFIFMAFHQDFDKKIQAALLPEQDIIISKNGVFTGWINPPKYTSLPPVLIINGESPLKVPVGSSLSARVFGGDGIIELNMGNKKEIFVHIDKDNAAIESIIDKNTDLIIKQNKNIIFKRNIEAVPDSAPLVDFIEKPKATIKGVLDIDYVFSDDYEITKFYAQIVLKKPIMLSKLAEIKFNIPFEGSDDKQTIGQYYYDLSEHIWAGLPAKVILVAEDYIGQNGKSRELEMRLPEKPFNNLLALSVINQRKNLALSKEEPFEVGKILTEIIEGGSFDNKLLVAKDWLLEASNILLESSDNSLLTNKKKNFVIDLLWKTALFIESGQLSIAENELRRAQQDLQEALSKGGEGAEIDEMMENLDNALAKYLEELENPMDIDAPQVSESDNPGDRGGENGAQSNEKADLEEKLEDIAELTASGSLDEAQEQLDQMQDMSESLDRDALGEALGEEEGETPMAMQQISEMMQEQEALMEDSFDQSMNAAQADQKMPGSGPVNAGEKQESLRKQLEDVMHEISESDTPLPDELGRAERSMRQAQKELQRGRPDRAQAAQGRAIEELKKAAEKMDKMHSGNGPSQMTGDSGSNSDRDQRDPLGRVPPGQGNSPGGDVGIPTEQDSTKARKIAKELYRKAESSIKGSIERKYVDSLLDWY